ncbi:hypothetical protein ALC60_13674, partial [Trachymyrmex zeteki]
QNNVILLPFLIVSVVSPNMARKVNLSSEYCSLAGGPFVIQRSTSLVSSSPSESELHMIPVFFSLLRLRLFSAKSRDDVSSFGISGIRKDFSLLVTSCLLKALLRSGTFSTAGSHFTEISVKLLHLSVKQNAVVFSSLLLVEKFKSFS